MTQPRYQDVSAPEIPEILEDDGTRVKVIVGSFWGKTGPVDGISADPQYLDIFVPAGVKKTFPVDLYRKAFAYVLISGKPIQEPVAWHGPIVMNTPDEIEQAMRDLRNGTFIKPAHWDRDLRIS